MRMAGRLPEEPPPLRAVLFDAGDTLIRLRGEPGALVRRAAAGLGVTLEPLLAEQLWAGILARASTPGELAKGRDLSAPVGCDWVCSGGSRSRWRPAP
ncbi:MAG: hypothetical protein ACXVGR_12225 [Mycobacteriaceae bacterium]